MRLSAGSLLLFLACVGAICPGESIAAPAGGDKEQVGSRIVYAVTDREGRKESEISGERAEVLPSGDVEVTNLRLLLYGKAGDGDIRMTSSNCIYRIDEEVVESKSDVRVVGSNVVISGASFIWSSKERRVRVIGNVRVEIKNRRGWTLNERHIKD